MDLNESITKLKGIGDKNKHNLKRLGIETLYDLLHHFPRRYIDFSKVSNIGVVKPGLVTIKGKIESVKTRYTRQRKSITEAVISDGTGKLKLVWFNAPYIRDTLPKDTDVYVSGELKLNYNQYSILHPSIEKVSEFTTDTARIVPVYPETKGFNSRQFRKLIKDALEEIGELSEPLPKSTIKDNKLIPKDDAIKTLHFPERINDLRAAKARMAFEEVFELVLSSRIVRKNAENGKGIAVPFAEDSTKEFVSSLNFNLTGAQKRAAWEIIRYMEKPSPMNSLLQGDVGSGKTVVAAIAALQVISYGLQAAMIAPTEILAAQHSKNLDELFKKQGVNVELIVGGKSKQKDELIKKVSDGSIDIAVGTHALLQKDIKFENLGLVIIDEQHRFGVRQRQQLLKMNKIMPHLLSMSATPIPRSLALTLYGELDILTIDELPRGRKPAITRIATKRDKDTIYAKIDKQISEGRQVFVVCPLIEPSDKLGVKSVEQEYERLKKNIFPHRKIGLLHGKLKPKEKTNVMNEFNEGEIDILVSTTVVEVGVDVPNASIMLVEGAERFGLAQLHQLRGRVGRSKHQAYCYLMSSNTKVTERLKAMEQTNSGFKLAEIDLKLRGPGEIYGTSQHGLFNLRIADITDIKLIEKAQKSADNFLSSEKLEDYEELAKRVEELSAITTLN